MDKRNQLAKDKLRKSLLKLISYKSIYKISIKEICDEASINRSTFYRYYDTQFDLFYELQEEASLILKELLVKKPLLNEENLEIYLNYIKTNILYFEPFFFGESCDLFRKRFYEYSGAFLNSLTGISKEYIEYATSYVGHGSLSIIKIWINNGFDTPVKDLAHILFEYNKSVAGTLYSK